MKKIEKIKLINWNNVPVTVKGSLLDSDEVKEYLDNHFVYYKQPKAWELYFVLLFEIIIYTSFAMLFKYEVISDSSILFIIPAIGMIMTVFLFADTMDNFTWIIRIPFILYLLGIMIYVVGIMGAYS